MWIFGLSVPLGTNKLQKPKIYALNIILIKVYQIYQIFYKSILILERFINLLVSFYHDLFKKYLKNKTCHEIVPICKI